MLRSSAACDCGFQAARELAKERKACLSKSNVMGVLRDEGAEKDPLYYVSETRSRMTGAYSTASDPPLPTQRPRTQQGTRELARWSQAQTQAPRQSNHMRSRPALRVPEMPESGSAENPTYLNIRIPPEELKASSRPRFHRLHLHQHAGHVLFQVLDRT